MKNVILTLALVFSGHVFAQESTNQTAAKGMANATVQKTGNLNKTVWYYESGKVKEIGYFKNGLKHGTWTSYDEDGNKIMQANYVNGVKEGNWCVWHTNGLLKYHMVYEDGKRILSTEWDVDGNVVAGNQSK